MKNKKDHKNTKIMKNEQNGERFHNTSVLLSNKLQKLDFKKKNDKNKSPETLP